MNPIGMSKEAWFEKHAVETIGVEIMDGYHPVCLIDNGYMTAAGIAYCQEEFEEFQREDGRPKNWYLIKDSDLKEVCPSVPLS